MTQGVTYARPIQPNLMSNNGESVQQGEHTAVNRKAKDKDKKSLERSWVVCLRIMFVYCGWLAEFSAASFYPGRDGSPPATYVNNPSRSRFVDFGGNDSDIETDAEAEWFDEPQIDDPAQKKTSKTSEATAIEVCFATFIVSTYLWLFL
jgi:hypothetical protein